MVSQQSRVTVQLREMILNGAFEPGQRITEVSLANTLGVSRTPIRYALGVIEQEGLVTGIPHRGFRVEKFSAQDIYDAIDLRGVLEGMAARLLAERGMSPELLASLHQCLVAGDRIVAKSAIDADDIADYDDMNTEFHSAIVHSAGNRALENALKQNDKIPFAAASALAMPNPQSVSTLFRRGQAQHHDLVEALENGEGARAEALMREHALVTKKALNFTDQDLTGADPLKLRGLRLA